MVKITLDIDGMALSLIHILPPTRRSMHWAIRGRKSAQTAPYRSRRACSQSAGIPYPAPTAVPQL